MQHTQDRCPLHNKASNIMIKFTYCVFLILMISSCVGSTKKVGNVDLIFYTYFTNPKETYDSLITDFTRSGLVDSIKIIGRPITVPSLDIQIDTAAAHRYGILLETLKEKIDMLHQLASPDELSEQFVINKSGQKIPVPAFLEVYIKPEQYKPKIFIPKPEVYHYKDQRAVKMEIYCKRKNEKKLIEFIQSRVPDYSGEFVDEAWRFEFIQ